VTYDIAVLPGDGIGPEVTAQAVRVLERTGSLFDIDLKLGHYAIGGAAIDTAGKPLPQETLEACEAASAVFLGAVGGPKWASVPVELRPEQGLLALRKALKLYANLRPVKTLPELAAASPLKNERLAGVDLVVVRELTGGLYFGRRERTATSAYDTCEYTSEEIERICRTAGELARSRRRKCASVDKANVLDTSRLWRDVATRLFADEFPDVELEHVLVDTAAMRLVSRPAEFDVLVMDNMFGDILSDESSVLAGSMGLLPSVSLSDGQAALYEPIHGSAPDIAGRDIANPAGAILSIALMLRHSLEADAAADAVESAVESTLKAGTRTADLKATAMTPAVGTVAFGSAVLERLAASI
jgi:3-isopropylmalate dehydrogenase